MVDVFDFFVLLFYGTLFRFFVVFFCGVLWHFVFLLLGE